MLNDVIQCDVITLSPSYYTFSLTQELIKSKILLQHNICCKICQCFISYMNLSILLFEKRCVLYKLLYDIKFSRHCEHNGYYALKICLI